MPKSRLSGDGRKTRRSTVKSELQSSDMGDAKAHPGPVHRFIGLSLGGGKTDKACLAVLEYYPKHKKVFLSRLVERIKTEGDVSGDAHIVNEVRSFKNVESVAFDVPYRLPQCLHCVPGCDGMENCPSEHIQWMWKHAEKHLKVKRPKKLFTPYTQRCVELYVNHELEEKFSMQHAMGSNVAPLLARAMYLKNKLQLPTLEVYPKLSVWRVGRSLDVMKSHLRFHKHSIGGDASRREILQALNEHSVAFVYNEDIKLMIENNHAFEAFICALTGFLEYQGVTEPRPKGFPKAEDWISFPQQNLKWNFF